MNMMLAALPFACMLILAPSAFAASIDYAVAGTVTVDPTNIQKLLNSSTFSTQGSIYTNGTMRTIYYNSTTVSTGGWRFIPPTVTIKAANPVPSYNYTWCAGYFEVGGTIDFKNVSSLDALYFLIQFGIATDSAICTSNLKPSGIGSNDPAIVNPVVGPVYQQVIGNNSGALTTSFNFEQAFLDPSKQSSNFVKSTKEIYFMVIVIRTTTNLSIVFTPNPDIAFSNAFTDYSYSSPPSSPPPRPPSPPPPRPSPPPAPPKAADRALPALFLFISTLIATVLLVLI